MYLAEMFVGVVFTFHSDNSHKISLFLSKCKCLKIMNKLLKKQTSKLKKKGLKLIKFQISNV